jgi:predicted transcriptional regulator
MRQMRARTLQEILPGFRPKEISRPKFGRLIRQLRKDMGITQVQIAKALGTSQANLCKMEMGQVEPSVGVFVNAAMIARLYGCKDHFKQAMRSAR